MVILILVHKYVFKEAWDVPSGKTGCGLGVLENEYRLFA
jgi:hypothetical protein